MRALNTEPKKKIIEERSINFRGLIIDIVADTERYMDRYIARFFCEDSETKQQDFIDLILGNNRLSLDGKRKLVDNILQRKGSKQDYKEYSKHMNVLMKERNAFAHNATDYSEQALLKCNTHLGLIKFGTNAKTEWYDLQKLKEIEASIKTINAIFYLANEKKS